MIKIGNYIRPCVWIAVQADRAGILINPTTDVEDRFIYMLCPRVDRQRSSVSIAKSA
jgi:hypothetical protein